MGDKVRIGFVGVGRMGQAAHLRHYASLPDCQVVALAELRPQLRQRVAQRYGVSQTYARAEQMLASEKLDGIVAAQQFTNHGSILPALYRAGVPVLSEKPLAGSVEIGEQLLSELRAGGSWHMVGYHKRSDPAVIYAKAEMDRLRNSGELGPLNYVRITMPPGDWVAGGFDELIDTGETVPSIDEDPPPPGMSADACKRMWAYVNFYIHQVNLMRHLLGEPYELTFADASGAMLAVRGTRSGVCGVIEMSPYQISAGWDETVLIAFKHGYLFIELPAPLAQAQSGRLRIVRDPPGGTGPKVEIPSLPALSAMRQQAVNFLRAIRGEAPPPCDAAEALEDLRIAREYMRRMEQR
jgi:predicted dehydrogenase